MAVDATADADALAAIGRATMTDRQVNPVVHALVDPVIPAVVRLFLPAAVPVRAMDLAVLYQALASHLRRLLPVTVDAGRKSIPAQDLLPARYHRHRHVRLMTTDVAAVADVSCLSHPRPLVHKRPYKMTESPPDDGDFVFCNCNFSYAHDVIDHFYACFFHMAYNTTGQAAISGYP